MPDIGYYTLPVILSFKGIDAQVNKELGDKLKPAAKKAGEDAGKQLDESLGKSAKEGLGQAAKGPGRGIRQRRPRRHQPGDERVCHRRAPRKQRRASSPADSSTVSTDKRRGDRLTGALTFPATSAYSDSPAPSTGVLSTPIWR